MPDRLKASEAGNTSNILDGDNTFCIRIRDYNMVASNLSNTDSNANSLTMELYIEDNKNGKEMNINGESVKVSKISVSGKADILKKYSDGQTITVNQEGQFKLQGNDTFQFSLNDMESYLKETNTTYKKECRIFAKVASTVTLYGVTANKETWTSVSLKPRQLFDLDQSEIYDILYMSPADTGLPDYFMWIIIQKDCKKTQYLQIKRGE